MRGSRSKVVSVIQGRGGDSMTATLKAGLCRLLEVRLGDHDETLEN